MKLYTCTFAFNKDSVLLLRKHEPKWQRGKLNGIGGKVNEGETIIAATVREFREETGLFSVPTQPLIYHAMLWPDYEDHKDWPLVYFSALELPRELMQEAVENTIHAIEPCVIVKAAKVEPSNPEFMPNLPFLVEMAECLVRCTPAERQLRQPVVFHPETYADLIVAGKAIRPL